SVTASAMHQGQISSSCSSAANTGPRSMNPRARPQTTQLFRVSTTEPVPTGSGWYGNSGSGFIGASVARFAFDSCLYESLASLTQLSRLGKVIHASLSARAPAARRARGVRVRLRRPQGRQPVGRRLLDPDGRVPEARSRVREQRLVLELVRRFRGAEQGGRRRSARRR